ncbi:type VI secretion system protein TssL, partial [Burkholderia pseudomallei]
NLDLSRERAQAVRSLIAARLDRPELITAEGRGTLDPVAQNDSPANRARNRSVEITLILAPGSDAARATKEAT